MCSPLYTSNCWYSTVPFYNILQSFANLRCPYPVALDYQHSRIEFPSLADRRVFVIFQQRHSNYTYIFFIIRLSSRINFTAAPFYTLRLIGKIIRCFRLPEKRYTVFYNRGNDCQYTAFVTIKPVHNVPGAQANGSREKLASSDSIDT